MRVLFMSLIDSLPFRSMGQIVGQAKDTVTSFSGTSTIPGKQEIDDLLDGVFAAAAEAERLQSEGDDSGRPCLLKAAPASSLIELFVMNLLCVRGLSGYLVVWMEFVRRIRTLAETG
jgi:hypothetical protein